MANLTLLFNPLAKQAFLLYVTVIRKLQVCVESIFNTT